MPQVALLTEDLQVEIALALAAAGTKAMHIGSANQKTGTLVPILTASASSHAYAIVVRDDVLAIDCDTPFDPSVLVLRDEAQNEGLTTHLGSSGQEGHHHLYILGVSAEQHARLGRRARELGLDPRSGSDRIRPPLSPHRNLPGVTSTVEDPGGLLAGLRALGPPGRARTRPIPSLQPSAPAGSQVVAPIRKRTSLPDWAIDSTRGQNIPERYFDGNTLNRHRLDMGLANSYCIRGYTKDEFISIRLTPGTQSNKALEIQRTQGRRRAEHYLSVTWDSAVTFTSTHRTIAPNVYAELCSVWAVMQTFDFPKRRAAFLRRALTTILNKAQFLGRLEVGYSVRSFAEALGCADGTASGYLHELERLGFLEVAQDADGYESLGTVWRLKTPSPVTESSVLSPRNGGQIPSVSVLGKTEHLAFSRGALGATGYEVLMAYDPNEGRTRAEVVNQSGLSSSTVYRKTKDLVATGALVKDGKRYRRVDDFDMDAVAETSGANARAEAARARHQREREAHALLLDRAAQTLQANLEEVWADAGGTGPIPVVALGRNRAEDGLTHEELTASEAYRRLNRHARLQATSVEIDPQTGEIIVGEGGAVEGGARNGPSGSLRALDGPHGAGTVDAVIELAAFDSVADLLADHIGLPHLHEVLR